MSFMYAAFSDASAEQNDHVDYEESFFLFLEAETAMLRQCVSFGEEQSEPHASSLRSV